MPSLYGNRGSLDALFLPPIPAAHGAAGRDARVGGTGGGGGLHRSGGQAQQAFQVRGPALGAFDLIAGLHEGFERVFAVSAGVIVDRHSVHLRQRRRRRYTSLARCGMARSAELRLPCPFFATLARTASSCASRCSSTSGSDFGGGSGS